MRFSENWLRDLIDLPVDSRQLVEKFNLSGLEVDSVELAAPAFSGVLVAEIVAIEPHPDADRLRVCTVNVGQKDALQIVCGASNARKGLKAPLATVGAVLPGDFKIKQSKLRGVESFGMLCSEAELGLADKASGLLELPPDARVGQDIRDCLDLDDHIIGLDLTPNRGDCLGMFGLARECAAANHLQFVEPKLKAIKPAIKDTFPVAINAEQACPRYCGRVVRGIDAQAQTPIWMVERLRRGGIRAIHPVVDITNYVMLELGQPMHAFDLSLLDGGINVRMAKAEEAMTLLDGSEIELNDSSLVIADCKRVLALAGVMGGEDTGVTENTKNIFFESAFFAPMAVMGRARQYGLHTDSSHRFERGVDPQLQPRAIERATELLLAIAGGKAGPLMDIESKQNRKPASTIQLRKQQIERLVGCVVPDQDVSAMLEGLGCDLRTNKSGWQVSVPSYRFDLQIEADLIEEIARLRGYDLIPRRLPVSVPEHPQATETQIDIDRIKSVLTVKGYQEVVNYSFVDPVLHQRVVPDADVIQLGNPISADLSVMRSSLMPSLLENLRYNLNRQQKQLAIFEIAACYLAGGQDEVRHIAGLRFGRRDAEHWGVAEADLDFYDIKGDIESLLGLGQKQARFVAESHPALHPGQSARIYLDQSAIGWVGSVHPQLANRLEIGEGAFLFELELDFLLEAAAPRFAPISRFPGNRRDLAIVIDAAVSWEEVKLCVENSAPECLKELRLFDVYAGKGVESGRKSFAMGLILQEISRTLTDVEIESATAKVLAELNKNLGATLRE